MCNLYFYPRSPCGERHISFRYYMCIWQRFLSTLSLRRATDTRELYDDAGAYFYPRSPCGERPRAANCQHRSHQISIHALLAESDITGYFFDAMQIISIHALLAESDAVHCDTLSALAPISIHALLAESDTKQNKHQNPPRRFLSTLSLRRATVLR